MVGEAKLVSRPLAKWSRNRKFIYILSRCLIFEKSCQNFFFVLSLNRSNQFCVHLVTDLRNRYLVECILERTDRLR